MWNGAICPPEREAMIFKLYNNGFLSLFYTITADTNTLPGLLIWVYIRKNFLFSRKEAKKCHKAFSAWFIRQYSNYDIIYTCVDLNASIKSEWLCFISSPHSPASQSSSHTHSRFVRFVSFVCSHKINLDELILLCLFELGVIGSKSTLKSTLMPTHDGGVFSKERERERVFIEGWAVMILIIIATFKTRFKDTLLYSGRSSSYGTLWNPQYWNGAQTNHFTTNIYDFQTFF